MADQGDQQAQSRILADVKQLASIAGVSGHEQLVVGRLRELMAPFVDRVELDALGNLYAFRDGDGPTLMVGVHSDEIGGLVAAVDEDGFLRLQTVGGIAEGLLVGRKVRVRGHLGVVGVRPGHLLSAQEARTVPDLESLYIDMGLESRAEVGAIGITVGDQITWDSEVEVTANPRRLVGKGIDNRIGCAVLLELLRALQGEAVPCALAAVVAVQEEVGFKGAQVATERLRPDCALVIDTVPCTDTPDSRHVRGFPMRLGGGPIIQVSSGSHASGFLMPENVREFLTGLAAEEGIPFQLAAFAYGSTDAAGVYAAAGGVPTAVTTIPRRYSHSPVEMLDLGDALYTLRLAETVVRQAHRFPLSMLQA